MIHYITIHFKNPLWIDIQLKHINYHTDNFKVWALFGGGLDPESHKDKYYYIDHAENKHERGSRNHSRSLNRLAKIVCSDKNTKANDILVFLDSDCFPINNINQYIESKIKMHSFCAVNRFENAGDEIPHPSFAFCSVDFWEKNGLSWLPSTYDCGLGWDDVGGELLDYFSRNDIGWFKIKRTPKTSLFTDCSFFSSYGDIVYHHCAGSRELICRGTSDFMKKSPDSLKPCFSEIYSMLNDISLKAIKDGFFLTQNKF